MIELVAMVVVGLLLLGFSLVALVRALGGAIRNSAEAESELSNILRLASLEFDTLSLIFADTDYRTLASEPRLGLIARQLRRDRKRIALAWLLECQKDVMAMWRFRRFLISRGAPSAMGEELTEVCRSLGLIFLLAVLRVSVWLWGPYAFTRIVIGIRDDARQLRSACTRTLERLPQGKWPQVAAEWRSFQVAL